jgi:PAS domain S-box-containing protein
MAAGLSLALAGAIAVAMLIAYGERNARNTMLAGATLSAGVSCMLVMTISGLGAPMELGHNLAGVLAAMVAGTAVSCFGLHQLGRAATRRETWPVSLVALTLPLQAVASLTSILPFSGWDIASAPPGTLTLWPVTAVLVAEFIVVLLLARAGMVVDRQAAERTTGENARLRQLTESTFEGILVHRAGIVLDANGAFCRLVERDLDAVTGHALTEFAPDHVPVEGTPASGTAGTPQPREFVLRTATGGIIPVETLSRTIVLRNGTAEVMAVRDIRERRAAAQAKLDHERMAELQRDAEDSRERQNIAEQASRAKSAFLAMMSHEIRTPMNAVLGLTGALLDEPLSADHRRVVTAIRESGDSLMRILNDILDFSKLDAGRLTFELAAFSPATLTMGVLTAFGPRAASKGLQMHVEVDPALPPMVNGDAGRIRQVLHNLVANAVKFTNVGEIVIWARPAASDSDTATIEWTVSDTGIGIPAAQLGSLFNEFVQADNSVTRRFGGSGLGLAISRQIVEQMRGGIDVESMPGTGSTFRFRLTLECAKASRTAAQDPHAAEAALRRRINRLGRTLRLLVAEDDPTNQFVLLRLLKGFDIRVDVANDGADAVRAAARLSFDLICMDMRMPEMDGLQATLAIRSGGGTSRTVPIIALTASTFAEDIQACRDAGMNDFVAKPVGKQKLIEAILRSLPEDAAATGESTRKAMPIAL